MTSLSMSRYINFLKIANILLKIKIAFCSKFDYNQNNSIDLEKKNEKNRDTLELCFINQRLFK